jgi:hypothetical protein
MPIDNDLTLDILLKQDMQIIINEVSADLLDALKKNIQSIVYNPFHPKKYERQKGSGGFLGSWDKTNSEIKGKNIESLITNDLDNGGTVMAHSPNDFIHGSNYSILGDDVRNVLAEIINEGKSGSYFDWTEPPHWWKSPRMFWQATEELILNGWVDGQIEKAFRRHGIKFRKL